jgi:hypothetical protein
MAVQFTKLSVSPEVVQTTGTSETAVMSQKAVTDALANAGGGSSGGSGGVTRKEIEINATATTGTTNKDSLDNYFEEKYFGATGLNAVVGSEKVTEILEEINKGKSCFVDITYKNNNYVSKVDYYKGYVSEDKLVVYKGYFSIFLDSTHTRFYVYHYNGGFAIGQFSNSSSAAKLQITINKLIFIG